MSNDSLVVQGLSAGYRKKLVLRNLSLPEMHTGETIALVGPNGAGKSTLLRSLAGLVPATGSARLGDFELVKADPPARARRVAFMPQSIPERVALTVLEGVIAAVKASPLEQAKTGSMDVERIAIETLARIGIENLALEPLDRLSGGQRQMASLAQAVARSPRLLLLDEPTSALDLRHQAVVMQLVRSLAAEGRIVVMVVHDLNLAVRWADTVVVMSQGEARAAGTPTTSITPEVLRDVYAVEARVERCSVGRLQVIVDGLVDIAK
jgi:iron complex transport system ATP-binding protein